jgi:hypothetical protein
VSLPGLPDDCRAQEAHAALSAGMEAVTVLARERAALDRANGRVAGCAAFYDDVKGNLEGKQ